MFGGVSSIFSLIFGFALKYIGLQTTMVMMLMTAIAHAIFIISWTASYESGGYVIFLMILALSFSNSLSTAQVRAVFGIYFPNNPSSYSAAMLFETIGLVIGSILSVFFCTKIKAYAYLGIAAIGILSYITLEIKTKLKTQ